MDGWQMDSTGSRQGPAVGSCKNSNEHSGSIKCGDFFD
jgi:hypothetical protein